MAKNSVVFFFQRNSEMKTLHVYFNLQHILIMSCAGLAHVYHESNETMVEIHQINDFSLP